MQAKSQELSPDSLYQVPDKPIDRIAVSITITETEGSHLPLQKISVTVSPAAFIAACVFCRSSV